MDYLIDTSILVRTVDSGDSDSKIARRALIALARSGHRLQRRQPRQHLAEQFAVEMPFGQQEPVVAGMLDQPTASLHQPVLQSWALAAAFRRPWA